MMIIMRVRQKMDHKDKRGSFEKKNKMVICNLLISLPFKVKIKFCCKMWLSMSDVSKVGKTAKFKLVYRSRAINNRGYYSKIRFFALKLAHRKHIRIVF